jgi:hypothetical protein
MTWRDVACAAESARIGALGIALDDRNGETLAREIMRGAKANDAAAANDHVHFMKADN